MNKIFKDQPSVYFSVHSQDDSVEEKKEKELSHNITNIPSKMDTTDSSSSTVMPISSSSTSNTKMNKIFSVKSDSKNNSSENLNSQCGSNMNISKSTNSNNYNSKNDENCLTKYGVSTNKLNELDAIMNNLDLWGIDVFLIDQLTTHSPLVAVTYTIFQV